MFQQNWGPQQWNDTTFPAITSQVESHSALRLSASRIYSNVVMNRLGSIPYAFDVHSPTPCTLQSMLKPRSPSTRAWPNGRAGPQTPNTYSYITLSRYVGSPPFWLNGSANPSSWTFSFVKLLFPSVSLICLGIHVFSSAQSDSGWMCLLVHNELVLRLVLDVLRF